MTDFTHINQVNAILQFLKHVEAWPQLKAPYQVSAWEEVHRLLRPTPKDPELPLPKPDKERR
jgi:hypothetical protein